MNKETYPHAPFKRSRRDFLRLGAGIGCMALAGSASSIEDTRRRDFESLHREYPQLEDVAFYRSSLGLSGAPQELQNPTAFLHEDWPIPDTRFEIFLPETLMSYGMLNEDIQREALGNASGRLVNAIKVNKDSTNFTFVDSDERFVEIPISVHQTTPIDSYVDKIFHEAIGHGTDPNRKRSIYPTNLLIEVSRAKWKMLSQAYSVEGQFFNHPKDLMLPKVKRKLGEDVALNLKQGTLDLVFKDEASMESTWQIARGMARSNNIPFEELKYNKMRCRLLGEKVFAMINEKEGILTGHTQKWFEETVESALVEIYAEMVRIGILHPKLIQNNRNIIEGCSELLTAINGRKIDLKQLRANAFSIDQSIINKNEQEKSLIELANSEESTQTNSQVPIPRQIVQYKAIKTSFEDHFYNFVINGELPPVKIRSRELENLCQRFALVRSKVESFYPIREISISDLDESFDPELDIWDIRTVEKALSNGYVRRLINELQSNTPKIDRSRLALRVEILEDFIESDAFGT